MYQRPDTPQSIGGVLDDGFKLYRESLSRVVVLTFPAMLAGQLPSLMVNPAAPLPNLGLLIAVLLSMVISLLLYGATLGRMHAIAGQADLPVGAALSLGVARLMPLLVFMILYGIIIAVGLLLLIVPGILFSVSLMFGTYVVIVEGKGPLEGLAGSHRLVWGHWWRTLIIVSVAGVIVGALYLLAAVAIGIAAAFGGAEPGSLTIRLFELVLLPMLGAVVMPLFYALTLATYYDLRLRRSGTDLEARLGGPAEA